MRYPDEEFFMDPMHRRSMLAGLALAELRGCNKKGTGTSKTRSQSPFCYSFVALALVALTSDGLSAGDPNQTRYDCYGEPLPAGVIARLGTMRTHNSQRPFGPTAVFSPDGKILATGGTAHIRLWEFPSGKVLRDIRDGKRTESDCALAFLPDGRQFASLGYHWLCIWDVSTGQRLREAAATGYTLVCSRDGKLLAASTMDGSIYVWETVSLRQLAQFRHDEKRYWFEKVNPPVFTKDGKGLVTFARSNYDLRKVYHWDLTNGTLRAKIDLPDSPSDLSPDGSLAVVLSDYRREIEDPRDETPSLWDTAAGKERIKLKVKSTGIHIRDRRDYAAGMAFSPDGRTLATRVDDITAQGEQETIAIWDVKTGELRSRLRMPALPLKRIELSPDGRMLLTIGYEQALHVWDIETGKIVLDWPTHDQVVKSVAFTLDGRHLVTAGVEGPVRLWDVATGRQVRQLEGNLQEWSDTPNRLVVGQLATAASGISAIVYPDADGTIHIHDEDGQLRRRIPLGKYGVVRSIALSPGGNTIATWSRARKLPGDAWYRLGKGTVNLWDAGNSKCVLSRPGMQWHTITFPRFSPDAKLVAEETIESRVDPQSPDQTSYPQGFHIWETSTGRKIRVLVDDSQRPYGEDFTADGRTYLSVSTNPTPNLPGGIDTILHLWELATGEERFAIILYTGYKAAVSPDGQTVAMARPGQIEFWDTYTGEKLPGQFEGVAGHLFYSPDSIFLTSDVYAGHLAYSPDSKLLTSGVYVWKVPPVEGRAPGGKVDAAQLEKWWTDLASASARRAHVAIGGLSRTPTETIRLFRERLRVPVEPSVQKIQTLIADLDAATSQRREAAAKELAELGEHAAGPLEEALKGQPSAERRRRIEDLLNGISHTTYRIRDVRAVETLERIANTEAQELLRKLATGKPEARLTREAQASLRRLTHQD
jgi:WD40 repeat protein